MNTDSQIDEKNLRLIAFDPAAKAMPEENARTLVSAAMLIEHYLRYGRPPSDPVVAAVIAAPGHPRPVVS